MEPGDAFHTLRQPPTAQPAPVLIFGMHIVVGFRPVHPSKNQLLDSSLTGTRHDREPEDPSSPLIVQCSVHAIPPAITGNLTTWPGHDLDVELQALLSAVLTGQWLSDHPGPAGKTTTINPY